MLPWQTNKILTFPILSTLIFPFLHFYSYSTHTILSHFHSYFYSYFHLYFYIFSFILSKLLSKTKLSNSTEAAVIYRYNHLSQIPIISSVLVLIFLIQFFLKPIHFFLGILILQMGIGIQGNAYIGMPHKILERFRVHP